MLVVRRYLSFHDRFARPKNDSMSYPVQLPSNATTVAALPAYCGRSFGNVIPSRKFQSLLFHSALVPPVISNFRSGLRLGLAFAYVSITYRLAVLLPICASPPTSSA